MMTVFRIPLLTAFSSDLKMYHFLKWNIHAKGWLKEVPFRIFFLFLLFQVAIAPITQAQNDAIDSYSFEGCQFASNVTGQGILPVGGIGCDCGLVGDGLVLDGLDDGVDSITLNNRFFEQDFSIRFTFLPLGSGGSFDLLSKKNDCVGDSTFTVRYDGSLNQVRVEMTEAIGQSLILSGDLNPDICWHELVFMRRDDEYFLFVDGDLQERQFVELGISLINDAPFRISGGPCVPDFENHFDGLFDELAFFDRALLLNEIGAELRTDFLITQDTLIFSGGAVPIRSSINCADQFSWTPSTDVSDPTVANPVLTPSVSTTYQVVYTSDECTTVDSLRVVVIEPDQLNCEQLDLPTAFSPNGDGLNDFFGISNPFIIEQLESFDLYDRQGAIVYSFVNSTDLWDGSYGNGSKLMPGVYVYKVRYTCLSEKQLKIGTLVMLK